MFAGKPIIGIIGGIGSGKTVVARAFGDLGCLVIDSDQQVSQVYRRDDIKRELVSWWGPQVLDKGGNVNRAAIAEMVFADPAQRRRLECLVHPLIARIRDDAMAAAAGDPALVGYVWDAPLLIEADLARHCDAIVFVDAPWDQRLGRVQRDRGWDAAELAQREKSQMALDKKREIANYIVRNTAGLDDVRSQVREVLSRILAGIPRR